MYAAETPRLRPGWDRCPGKREVRYVKAYTFSAYRDLHHDAHHDLSANVAENFKVGGNEQDLSIHTSGHALKC